jgi:hypothetical protein
MPVRKGWGSDVRGTGTLKMTGFDANDEEQAPDESIGNRSDAGSKERRSTSKSSLLAAIDDAGLSLKPRAEKAVARLALSQSRGRKAGYLVQSSLLYVGFILYRAYRGFFVILPEVFRRVYDRLERAVDAAPFDDSGKSKSSSNAQSSAEDVDPETGRVRWRTRLTVSVLASIVTTSYVVGGAVRVGARFVSSLLGTSSVSESFRAAAVEQEDNESKILRKLSIPVDVGGGTYGGAKINGTVNDGSNREGDGEDNGDTKPDSSNSKFSDLAP